MVFFIERHVTNVAVRCENMPFLPPCTLTTLCIALFYSFLYCTFLSLCTLCNKLQLTSR